MTEIKPVAVVIDVDATLANGEHRQHLFPSDLSDSKGWDAFHEKQIDDPPYPEMIPLVQHLYDKYSVIIMTARPDKWKEDTEEWLDKNEIHYDELIMRPTADCTKSAIWKVSQLKELSECYSIQFILEDQPKIVRAMRDAGYVCFEVRDSPVKD